jgi:thiol:disulfide interchange protein DsbA
VAAYDSFSIGSKVSRANQMVRDFKIRGTPTLIVDGQYVITGLTPTETIRELNELIVKVRKEHENRKH